MARHPNRQRRQRSQIFYIGEWIDLFGMNQVTLARAVGITEGYLSELISGRKKNPSYSILQAIADEIGVTMDDLKRPPPDAQTIDTISGLSPAVIDRLKAPKPR